MYPITLSDEDVQFINEAASILMPMYRAQQFLARLNGQVEESRKAQRAQAQEHLDAQIASGVIETLKKRGGEIPN